MSENSRFRVVIFSSGAARDIARLARRINREVPEARVAGVLCERRPGKSLDRRVSAFVRNLKQPEFLNYAARRLAAVASDCLAAAGARILRFVHAAGPAREAQEDLDTICRSIDCALLVTADYHCEESLAFVRGLDADLGIVYGTRILKPPLFLIPRHGSINIHKRKVPDYRGGGPVGLWELLDGQSEIGVTVHEVTEKLDAGAVINASSIAIDPFDTLTSLALKAHVTGNDLLVRSVADYARGTVKRAPQTGQGRMFKGPSPQQLAVYRKQLASRRPQFQAMRGRSGVKLLLRSVAGLPAAVIRNWTRRIRGRFPVEILFHHVITDRPHDLGMSTEHFLRHVEFLRKFYNIVPLSEAIELLRTNNVKSPTVVLTFDDGYRDNFLTLRAIREHIDVPIALFVSTDHITSQNGFAHDIAGGRSGFPPLTWEQIRRLAGEGFEIGSHTKTHFDCGSTDVPRLEREIAGSKRDLEQQLNTAVELFSFPFGLPVNISQQAMKLASDNYPCVFSAFGGSNFAPASGHVKHLRRWFHANDLWELELTLQSFLDLAPPASANVPDSDFIAEVESRATLRM